MCWRLFDQKNIPKFNHDNGSVLQCKILQGTCNIAVSKCGPKWVFYHALPIFAMLTYNMPGQVVIHPEEVRLRLLNISKLGISIPVPAAFLLCSWADIKLTSNQKASDVPANSLKSNSKETQEVLLKRLIMAQALTCMAEVIILLNKFTNSLPWNFSRKSK